MSSTSLNRVCCDLCAIPLDAEYFDVSGIAKGIDLPQRGEQRVLASFQLHPQYCGVLTYFAQYTDVHASDPREIETPGFEWVIAQNGEPLFPYTRLNLIVNPWGANYLEFATRLKENARVEIAIRNVGAEGANGPAAFAGRLMGRYWYNDTFGTRARAWRG